MTELICWPLDNKQYTSVALGAAYAARSRGVLNADSFAAKTNGNNTVTVGKGGLHPRERSVGGVPVQPGRCDPDL